MKPILVLTTGGTIGSTLHNGIIHTNANYCRAIELYYERYGADISFEIVNLMNILSENLQKHHWEMMINAILQLNLSRYSGIIITHGSDTLSYTSSMLGLVLCSLPIPVVLTASDLVPDRPESNAVCNIRAAVLLICTIKKGIYTVYRNPNQDDCTIYLATRIHEADRFTGSFSTPFDIPLGKVTNDIIHFNNHQLIEKLSSHFQPYIPLSSPFTLSDDVMMLRPYPGLDYRSISIHHNCKAILHITYHSSSASSFTDNSALYLLQSCLQKEIPLYLASFPNDNVDLYESSYTLIQHGAIPLHHLTDETAFAKLLLCMNYYPHRHTELMKLPWFFEYF